MNILKEIMTAEPVRPAHKKKRKRRKPKTRDQYTKTDWFKWLWPTFSRYIRVRDCLATTGTTTHGKCVTCGKTYAFHKLQAGHFIPGRTDAILFDTEQVYAQCFRCNIKLQGMWHKYFLFMQAKFGIDRIMEMIARCDDEVDYTREWFEESDQYYESEYDRMKDEG